MIRKVKYFFARIISALMANPLFAKCPNSIHTPDESKRLDISNMKLVFEDDFSRELDPSVWKTIPDKPERRGGYWSEEQCFIKDGKLIIRTEYKKDGKYGAGWYTGTCSTQGLREYKHGYFEVSCKTPAAEGLWSAFWLQSESMADNWGTDGGKNGAEIDIMESPYYNDPVNTANAYRNTTIHTVHVDGYGDLYHNKRSYFYRPDKNMYKEFNTYGVLWTKKEYIFYINGKETWRTDFGVSQAPEFLWLSVEIAGKDNANPENTDNKFTWAGDIRNNPEKLMPADFVIDYVRVYQ
ncbi:MAG: glycoside hydrolase family 16 protein [Eubacterium sp.]|nr:glycoside hydrolase family 16 protein [Eubacterium sp.]